MPTNFPTSIDVLTNPTPDQSQAAVVTHSEQHGNLNDAIEAIQAYLLGGGAPSGGGTGVDAALRAELLSAATGSSIVGYAGVGSTVKAQLDAIGNIRVDLAAGTTGKGADMVGYAHPSLESIGKTLANHVTNGIPVTAYGTDAQLAVDATAATLKATAAAIASGKFAVEFPAGRTYRFAAGSASIDPGMGNMTYYGHGAASPIIFEEGTVTTGAFNRKHLFRHDQDATKKGILEFNNLHIQGTFTASGGDRGGTVLFLNHYAEIKVINCRLFDLSWMATACEAIGRVTVLGTTFERVARDMCRFRSSFNQIIIGNHFINCDDDAIACHQQDVLTGTAIREGIIIANNTFEDVLGVRALAGRMIQIRDNLFRRCKEHAINCVTDAGEGNTNQFAIDISGNQIFDMLGRAPFTAPCINAISIYGASRKGGTDTNQGIPGQYSTVVGWVRPWNNRNGAITSAANALPPDFYIKITNNTIIRTLPAVASYSTWGYGQAMRSTAFNNAAVTDAALLLDTSINLHGEARHVLVQGNTIANVFNCVKVDAQVGKYGHDALAIRGNDFSDFAGAAVNMLDSGSLQQSGASIMDNDIDGDPYHTHAERNTDGTWDTYNPTGSAVICTNIRGLHFCNNRIRNVRVPMYTSYEFEHVVVNNTLYCDPVAVGFNIGNKGIGYVPFGGRSYTHVIVGCDNLNDAPNFRLILSYPRLNASTIPTTGKYVTGHFVQSTTPSANVLGWVRATTGSAHLSGTDWKTVAAT